MNTKKAFKPVVGLAGEHVLGLGVERQRPLLQGEEAKIGQFRDSLGALLHQGNGGHEARLGVGRQVEAAAGQNALNEPGKAAVIGPADMPVVDVVELVPVQPGAALHHIGDVEPFDGFSVREELVVAMAPAELGQIVAHGLGQVAHVPKLFDRLGAVALGELAAVLAEDQGQVGPDRNLPAEGLVEQGLAAGVGEVLFAADHVGDAHVVVIDRDGEIVDHRAVGAQEDEILQILVGKTHRVADTVFDHRVAVHRRLEAHHMRRALLDGTRRLVAPGGAQGMAFGAGLFLQLFGFRNAHVATVGVAAVEKPVDRLLVFRRAGKLEHRLAVPFQAEPGQAVENHLHGGLGGAFTVGVFDAQQERAARMLCIQPVEKRRASIANVHGARGGGGDTGDDGLGHRESGG